MFKFLDQRKQTKMQWLQAPNQSNVDNISSVRHEASRQCRKKMKKYLKAKINELDTNSKIISQTCIGASVTTRRVTILELI